MHLYFNSNSNSNSNSFFITIYLYNLYVEQARVNLETEVPFDHSLEAISSYVHKIWADKLGTDKRSI